MYKLIKPFLFKIEPEKAHGLTIDALKRYKSFRFYSQSSINYLLIRIQRYHKRYKVIRTTIQLA